MVYGDGDSRRTHFGINGHIKIAAVLQPVANHVERKCFYPLDRLGKDSVQLGKDEVRIVLDIGRFPECLLVVDCDKGLNERCRGQLRYGQEAEYFVMFFPVNDAGTIATCGD